MFIDCRAILLELEAEIVVWLGLGLWLPGWFCLTVFHCRAILLEFEAEMVVWLGLGFWLHGWFWLTVF